MWFEEFGENMGRLMHIRGRGKSVFFSCFLTALFCCGNLFGDQIVNIQNPFPGGIAGSDLSGMNMNAPPLTDWFLNLTPSDQWTTAGNIATMNAWLNIVNAYILAQANTGDPGNLSGLDGLGMLTPPASGTSTTPAIQTTTTTSSALVIQTSAPSALIIQATTQTGPTPEPAALGWIGGALAMLALYARWRRKPLLS